MNERIGRMAFAVAIVAIGVESIVCSGTGVEFVRGHLVLPIMPYPPASVPLAIVLGLVTIVCGIAMLRPAWTAYGVIGFTATYLLCDLAFDLPRWATHLGNIPLLTLFFQPLHLAALAWLMPAAGRRNDWLAKIACAIVAAAMIVYGVDHFRDLHGIAALVPGWMPFPVFWTGFFGVAFVLGGIGFAIEPLRGLASAGSALMFAIFLFTIHLPRTLGAYGVPGAIRDPDEWCSIFIVVALIGGFLVHARLTAPAKSV